MSKTLVCLATFTFTLTSTAFGVEVKPLSIEPQNGSAFSVGVRSTQIFAGENISNGKFVADGNFSEGCSLSLASAQAPKVGSIVQILPGLRTSDTFTASIIDANGDAIGSADCVSKDGHKIDLGFLQKQFGSNLTIKEAPFAQDTGAKASQQDFGWALPKKSPPTFGELSLASKALYNRTWTSNKTGELNVARDLNYDDLNHFSFDNDPLNCQFDLKSYPLKKDHYKVTQIQQTQSPLDPKVTLSFALTDSTGISSGRVNCELASLQQYTVIRLNKLLGAGLAFSFKNEGSDSEVPPEAHVELSK